MKYKIEFGFGIGEDRHGRLIAQNDAKRAVRAICDKAASLFGGYTLLDTFGGWKNEQGRLVEEPGKTLVIYITDAMQEFANVEARKIKLVTLVKELLDQQAVAVITTEVEIEYL